MTCARTKNVICKHVEATKTFYLDLNSYLPEGVTVESAEVSTDDDSLTLSSAEIPGSDYTVNSGCPEKVLTAGRYILIQIADGTPDDEETIVTVKWTQSDGDIDAVDCRLEIAGTI